MGKLVYSSGRSLENSGELFPPTLWRTWYVRRISVDSPGPHSVSRLLQFWPFVIYLQEKTAAETAKRWNGIDEATAAVCYRTIIYI